MDVLTTIRNWREDVVLSTDMPVDAARAVIHETMSSHGYTTNNSLDSNGLALESTRDGPFLGRVLAPLPDRLLWRLKANGTTRISLAFAYFPEKLVFLLIISFMTLRFSQWSVAMTFMTVASNPFVGTICTLFSVLGLVLIQMTVNLIFSDRGNARRNILRTLASHAVQQGFSLQRVDSSRVSISDLLGYSYIAAVLVLVAPPLLSHLATIVDNRVVLVSVIAACVILVLLLWLLIAITITPGASDRLSLLLPGLLFVVGVAFGSVWQVIFLSLPTVSQESFVERLESSALSRFVIAAAFGGCLIVAMVVVGKALVVSREVLQIERDLKVRSGIALWEAAVDRRATRLSGVVVVVIWWILASALLALGGMCVWQFALWAAGSDPSALGLLKAFVAYLLADHDEPLVSVISALIWLSPLLFLTGCSAIGLFLLRRETLRLRRSIRSRSQEKARNEVQLVFDELVRRSGVTERIQVAVLPDARPVAFAARLRLGRVVPVVAVSRGCLSILEQRELEVLLAHELAHHLNGDVRRYHRLRVLARLTLVGDGFVTTLLQSREFELRADRTAVTRLGVHPESLASCIRKLDAVALFRGRDDLSTRRSLVRRAISWIVRPVEPFWRIYTGGSSLGYWHPVARERLQALAELRSASAGSASTS